MPDPRKPARVTLTDVRRAASKHGAALDVGESGTTYGFSIDAPAGRVWRATGCHAVVVATRPGPAEWRSEAYAAALVDMAAGTEACDVVGCDACEESREIDSSASSPRPK